MGAAGCVWSGGSTGEVQARQNVPCSQATLLRSVVLPGNGEVKSRGEGGRGARVEGVRERRELRKCG